MEGRLRPDFTRAADVKGRGGHPSFGCGVHAMAVRGMLCAGTGSGAVHRTGRAGCGRLVMDGMLCVQASCEQQVRTGGMLCGAV
eukprot:1156437-Pelagomonas_calceolata.AAC.5